MKAKKFLVAALLCASSAAYGAPETTEAIIDPNASIQDSELGLLSAIGLQLGPNMNSVSSTAEVAVPDASGRTRMMFGANAQIGLWNIFYVQPEVNFVQRGFTETTFVAGSRSDLELGMNYLELPLLLKIRPELGNARVRPFALAGPSLGLLLSRSAVERSRDQNGQVSVVSRSEREDDFSTFSLALHFGLGAEFALTESISAVAGLRYVAGLSNLGGVNQTTGMTRTIRASAVQLVGGVQIAL